MAGRWRGQVDLEESMENDSYFDSYLAVLHDRKTSMPLHTVSIDRALETRPVRYNLRSDHWREGVKKETQKWLDETFNEVENLCKLSA